MPLLRFVFDGGWGISFGTASKDTPLSRQSSIYALSECLLSFFVKVFVFSGNAFHL